mgnify:CR=1 FL=1
MKKILFLLLLTVNYCAFSQNLDTVSRYNAQIVTPTLNNIFTALFDNNFTLKITQTYGYTRESDGNYFAATRVGAPYYSIGKNYNELTMIWTDDDSLNNIATNELDKIGKPYSSGGFYHYSVRLKNGAIVNIAFKPNVSGGGSILAVRK